MYDKIKNSYLSLSVYGKVVLISPFVFGLAVYLDSSPPDLKDHDYPGIVQASSTNTVADTQTMIEINYEKIPHETMYVEDKSLKEGESVVKTKGETGEKTVTYEVTYRGGEEIERKKLKEEVLKKPVEEVVRIGVAATTHPETLGSTVTKKKESATSTKSTKNTETDSTEDTTMVDAEENCIRGGPKKMPKNIRCLYN